MLAIVPVKRLDIAKQRLSGCLGPAGRASLAARMARHVITQLLDSRLINKLVVVSDDPKIQLDCARLGIHFFKDAGQGLNNAVGNALKVHGSGRSESNDAVIIHADLPLFDIEEFDYVADHHLTGDKRQMTLVTDEAGEGSNVMFIRPWPEMIMSFGPSSARRHAEFARSAGISVALLKSPTLSFDCDLPSDVNRLIRLQTHFIPQMNMHLDMVL